MDSQCIAISYLAFRVFIFAFLFSPLDVVSMFWRNSFALGENRNAPFTHAQHCNLLVEMCVFVMPYESVYHSIIISPQHVSKRQKVKNTERSREIRTRCADEPPDDARTNRLTQTLQIPQPTPHRYRRFDAAATDDDSSFAIPIKNGIYLEGKLLCDYKFSFRQLKRRETQTKIMTWK